MASCPSPLREGRRRSRDEAAADLCGRPAPAPEVPWFWSDQYDLKLQIAGLPLDAATLVMRGDPAQERFAVFHLDPQNRLQAVEAVNAPAEFMAGRALILSRNEVAPDKLRDMSVSMKAVTA